MLRAETGPSDRSKLGLLDLRLKAGSWEPFTGSLGAGSWELEAHRIQITALVALSHS